LAPPVPPAGYRTVRTPGCGRIGGGPTSSRVPAPVLNSPPAGFPRFFLHVHLLSAFREGGKRGGENVNHRKGRLPGERAIDLADGSACRCQSEMPPGSCPNMSGLIFSVGRAGRGIGGQANSWRRSRALPNGKNKTNSRNHRAAGPGQTTGGPTNLGASECKGGKLLMAISPFFF